MSTDTLSEHRRRLSTPGAVRAWEQHFTLYRTIWHTNVMGAFLQPLLYLLGMGLGVGALVDRGDDTGELLEGLTYFEFLAPALLATTAMMVTIVEAMWPVVAGFKWMRTYHAQAATSLTPAQVAGGTALWQLTKATISVSGVAAVLVLFDGTRSWGLLLAVPFGALTGIAFAAPMMAFSASRESDQSFPTINRFIIMPLFLFGGAFYPISQLPDWMEPIARATPLWHGVELCRGAVHGRLDWSLDAGWTSVWGHTAYLLAFVVVGWALATRSFERKLHT